MATMIHPDGTVEQLDLQAMIDEEQEELKAEETKPKKKRGRQANPNKEPKAIFGATIPTAWKEDLIKEFGNPTKAINALVKMHRERKNNIT